MESMPVASRSRKQRELREKELREKNKRARLAARNEHWKRNAAKRSDPRLGDDNGENVIVVDESAYLKRNCMVGGKESFLNVDGSFGENSDDSVQVLGEQWNPLGAGFDNNEDGDYVDGVAVDFQPGLSKANSEGCSDNGVDNQSLSMHAGSEDNGVAVDFQPCPSKASSKGCSHNGVDFQPGLSKANSKGCTDNGVDNQSSSMHAGSEGSASASASDGHCSSPLQSSETDDNVSDEDFRVDDAEMQIVYGSDSSQNSSSYASEKEGKRKKKTRDKKINERVLEEDIQSRAGIDEEIQSKDEFDGDSLQQLRRHYGSCSNEGETAEIVGSSVNRCNRKRGRPKKNRSLGFEYEAE
ncbi:hypothetical protein KSS87_010108, partial [Heliosperma pusillum]